MGRGRWCDRLLVTTILLMVFCAVGSLQERFFEARGVVVGMYRSRRRPGKSYTGFMNKLRRHSPRLLELVTGSLRGKVVELAGENWRVHGHLAFGVDGSKSDATRTLANRNSLKIGGKRKSGPQQLLVALMHVGTGLLWSFRRDVATGSERGLLLEQLGLLPPAALLLADAGFVGFDVIGRILSSGRQILMRAGANVKLIEKLGFHTDERDGLVYIWPDKFKKCEPLALRRIIFVDGRNRRMCLLTSILDPRKLTDEAALALYKKRWGIELFYRGLKQTLGRRKMLSDSPAQARVELDWTMAGYWMLGLMLWEQRKDKAPVSTGLAFALRVVRRFMADNGDGRRSWESSWAELKVDSYKRRGVKHSKDWPHKKTEKPCGVPKLRMATEAEVQLAKAIKMRKLAA
jgi:hypothetical protein